MACAAQGHQNSSYGTYNFQAMESYIKSIFQCNKVWIFSFSAKHRDSKRNNHTNILKNASLLEKLIELSFVMLQVRNSLTCQLWIFCWNFTAQSWSICKFQFQPFRYCGNVIECCMYDIIRNKLSSVYMALLMNAMYPHMVYECTAIPTFRNAELR